MGPKRRCKRCRTGWTVLVPSTSRSTCCASPTPPDIICIVPATASEAIARESLAAEAMAGEYLEHVRVRLAERGLTVTAEVRRGFTPCEIVRAVSSGDVLVLSLSAPGPAC